MNNVSNITTLTATMDFWAEQRREHLQLQEDSARANIETRDQLFEQNELLRKQLSEQNEINQRLEYEFKMGAREAVITRRKANWSLILAIISLIVTIISIITNM